MKRTHLSHLKEILIRLAELREELDKLHWEIGEDIPIEKSIAITKATASLQTAISHLTGVI